jgi:hypothetical protein
MNSDRKFGTFEPQISADNTDRKKKNPKAGLGFSDQCLSAEICGSTSSLRLLNA